MKIFINKCIYTVAMIGVFGSMHAMQRVAGAIKGGRSVARVASLFRPNQAQTLFIMEQLERSRQLTGLKTGDALLQRNVGAYSSLFSSSVNLHESWQRNFASKSKPEILKKYEGLNKKVEIEIYKLLAGAVGLGLIWNVYSYIKNTSRDVIEVRQTVHAIEKMLEHNEASQHQKTEQVKVA